MQQRQFFCGFNLKGKMDRSQLIGTFLIALILGGYFLYVSQNPPEIPQNEQQIQAEALTGDKNEVRSDKFAETPDSVLNEKMGIFAQALKGENREITLENDDVRIDLNTKGAAVKRVELKKYKNYDKGKLILLDEKSSKVLQSLKTKYGDLLLNDLFFVVSKDEKKIVTMTATLGENQSIEVTYSLDEKGFALKTYYKLNLEPSYLTAPALFVSWNNRLKRLETDLEQCRIRATINFYDTDGSFDYLSETSQKPEKATPEKSVKWFAMKDRFFSSALIAENELKNTFFSSEVDPNDTASVKYLRADAEMPLQNQALSFSYFFGPNDYDVVSGVTDGFGKNVYLGWPVIAPITRFIIIPLFNVFEKVSTNYGVVIILLVLFVRLLMSPLTYKAYLSQAKMKAIQPELNALKERYGEDMTTISQEQWKLYQQVGINPLSGCIPLVLQMPIFLALFTFFPNAIQLRGQSFLWATDLSTFDSIINLPFNVPFLGAHISLFTLLMSVTQIGISEYSMQTTQQPANSPINMKVFVYMMPVMFFFMLNSYPAGLTMYYFISNLITISQNFAIRKFFVDDDKVRAMLNKNRERNLANPQKKSSFQQRLEDAMRASQELKEKEKKDKEKGKDNQDNKKKK